MTAYYRPRPFRAWLFNAESASAPPEFLTWALNRWPAVGGVKIYPTGTGSHDDGFWDTNAHIDYNGTEARTRWKAGTFVIEDKPLRFAFEDEFNAAYVRADME